MKLHTGTGESKILKTNMLEKKIYKVPQIKKI